MPKVKVEHPALDLDADKKLPPITKVLIVDDDALVREVVGLTLKRSGFHVVAASNVKDALKHVSAEPFDVLVSDLHMPEPGDGLTVVSAMRHSHPKAVTILLSAFPEMTEAAKAILKQTDEVLVKPVKVDALIDTITERLKRGTRTPRVVESVATILERETQSTIEEWLECVDFDPLVAIVPLDDDIRCAHLPQLFRDLIFRLRHPLPLGRRARISPAAAEHGVLRHRQGYSAAMLVEESRMLQVSIFQTLQNNLHKVDFSVLLVGVMAIADEVDSQLAQAMVSYIAESSISAMPVVDVEE
jgi:CheY-like chemotaxis protein